MFEALGVQAILGETAALVEAAALVETTLLWCTGCMSFETPHICRAVLRDLERLRDVVEV